MDVHLENKVLLLDCRRSDMQNAGARFQSDRRLEAANYESAVREMEELLSSRFPYFHSVAYRLLGDAADAEDAVQDAFFTAYQHLNQFRGDSPLSAWLASIVCNCARMLLRRRPRHAMISLDEPMGMQQEFPLAEQLACKGPSPEDECRRSEMNKHLAEAAEELTPALRRTLHLREVEGLSIRETAKILGVTSATVKSHLSRARARMCRSVSQRCRTRRRQ
jgi:RNA polymerase sigma-70 factor, ECF subfamily